MFLTYESLGDDSKELKKTNEHSLSRINVLALMVSSTYKSPLMGIYPSVYLSIHPSVRLYLSTYIYLTSVLSDHETSPVRYQRPPLNSSGWTWATSATRWRFGPFRKKHRAPSALLPPRVAPPPPELQDRRGFPRRAVRPSGLRGFRVPVVSVVGGEAEELQQLPVLGVDEVQRLLAAVVLQLGVGAQREEVAGGGLKKGYEL